MSEPSADKEYVRNLVTLWTNQNTIVYGRLTAISALQLAVFAGWFSTFTGSHVGYAALVASVGTILAWVSYKLVECDLRWKMEFGDKLRKADDRLLPTRDVGTLPGWKIMKGLVIGFCVIDFLLAAVALICWLNDSGTSAA